ncbi:MAG TPA: hypothetical protein VL854_03590, partial [Nitrososphaeraceae archaeon]|nr:hypothetical protein [Nitrososphaeraceae archaeon]
REALATLGVTVELSDKDHDTVLPVHYFKHIKTGATSPFVVFPLTDRLMEFTLVYFAKEIKKLGGELNYVREEENNNAGPVSIEGS